MDPIKLIHPIYLDVPMLVSFAAAIQGGVAMVTEVSEESANKNATSASASGRFGLTKLFQSLFDASVEVEGETAREKEVTQTRKESKAHTEASLAILLYHQLTQSDGYVSQVTNIEDIASYEPGALVEIAGTVEKNVIDQMIDTIDAINILSTLAPSNQQPQNTGKRSKDKSRQPHMDQQLVNFRDALDTDRKRTPISNVVVRCDTPDGLNVVVTMRSENLRDLTLSELDKNRVRVIGKITRILPKGESMSSFENYGMSLLKPKQLDEALNGIKNDENLNLPLNDISVAGPAWQILPLMIFV